MVLRYRYTYPTMSVMTSPERFESVNIICVGQIFSDPEFSQWPAADQEMFSGILHIVQCIIISYIGFTRAIYALLRLIV